jgi:radical SAM protein with 4Fe4S-binding SPASM domain
MCPTGNLSQKRPTGFMSDEVFDRILEQIRPHQTPLRFIRWGEPLSHPHVLNYLEACREADILTHVNTNGSKLTEEMMDGLINIPLDSIKFSFQGTDAKTYAEMRNIDFFDELVAVVTKLREKRGARLKPWIQISSTITYETPEMVLRFQEKMAPLAEMVNVGRTWFEGLDINAVRLRPHEIERLERLKELESTIKVHPECPEVFDKISINWNGTVTACCKDFDGKMEIGDVTKETLGEIWVSERMTHYRNMLAQMRHDELPLCRTCYASYANLVPPREED